MAAEIAEPATASAARRMTPSMPKRRKIGRRMWQDRYMYLLVLPGLIYLIVFRYVPMAGNVVAFQDYSPFLGFTGSPWVGWENFITTFTDPAIIVALKNTLILSALQIFFAFPAPIALALLLNSIVGERIKRVVQSIVYLPHFIGWVIVIAIWVALIGGAGSITEFLDQAGFGRMNVMTNADTFKLLVTSQVIWKETGWGTIIFFAALTSIPTERYEAAVMDGAGSWRRMWHISLPGMATVIALLLILRLGAVLSVGFEQLLLQQPFVGAEAAQVIDTFVYYRGILGGDWGLSTAAGLVKGVIGTILVVASNQIAKKVGGEGIF